MFNVQYHTYENDSPTPKMTHYPINQSSFYFIADSENF